MQMEQKEHIEKEKIWKDEFKKSKLYYNSKLNEMQHHIKRLEFENQHLKEIFGQDISKLIINDLNSFEENLFIADVNSRDKITVKLIQKYKSNEEFYKNTIKQLEENNNGLIQEIINLRESLGNREQ